MEVMIENVGDRDRVVRSIVGPALVGLGYTVMRGRRGRASGIATIVAGALILESAITRVCPLNAMLGIDTRKSR